MRSGTRGIMSDDTTIDGGDVNGWDRLVMGGFVVLLAFQLLGLFTPYLLDGPGTEGMRRNRPVSWFRGWTLRPRPRLRYVDWIHPERVLFAPVVLVALLVVGGVSAVRDGSATMRALGVLALLAAAGVVLLVVGYVRRPMADHVPTEPGTRFPTARTGYDIEEVDAAFLTLASLGPEEIAALRFRTRGGGYKKAAVDDVLEQARRQAPQRAAVNR